MDKITPTDQREFNLLEYELLEIDFKLADFEFFFKFSREYRDDPQADLYVANYSDSSPSQMLTCKVPIPAKSDLMKFEADFTIPAGESVDVKFSFRSHPLFIVRINAQDSSIWFLTYDLAGDELSPFCIRKPQSAQAGESSEVKPSDVKPLANFFTDYGEDDLTGAINWLREVTDNQSVDKLREFIEYFTEPNANMGDTLEQLHYALFIESDTFAEAYKLYRLRFNLKENPEPAELIANLIKEHQAK